MDELKIAVTSSSGGQNWLYGSRNPSFIIDGGWTEAWDKLAGSLERKLIQNLQSNSIFCREQCRFCDYWVQNLRIKINGQNGIVIFKVKKTDRLQQLMDRYCARVHMAADNVHFLFDGEMLSGTSTPEDLDMEHGNVIDAIHLDKQEGGNGSAGAEGQDAGAHSA